MKASKVIKELLELIVDEGDCEVCVNSDQRYDDITSLEVATNTEDKFKRLFVISTNNLT